MGYFVTCVETCVSYLNVLLKDLVLSVFLFFCLFLHDIAPYFHLAWICFCFNLMFVVALLWLNISFIISRKSFPNVERNLSHVNCIGSAWILYLLLICIVSVLTWVLSSLGVFLMLAWSAKLMQPTLMLSTILTLPMYSMSASLFQVWHITGFCSC